MDNNSLPPALSTAIDRFAQWSRQQLSTEQEAERITQPLYHYTNGAGLVGILKSQRIWFTSYRNLNDPSELLYGMGVVHRLLGELRQGCDELVEAFCARVDDLFQHRKFSDTFGFYIASFSRNRDDLGQWRAYADNGRGFALGLAPHLFEAVENPNPKATEYVVMPVVYGDSATVPRYRNAIEKAVSIVQESRQYLTDKRVEIEFLRRLANELIAGQLIGISLTVKHAAYSHEQEVRLVMLGTQKAQQRDVKTRIRGAEVVPFMEGEIPLRDKDGIVEIVIGPAADVSTRDAIQSLLKSFGVDRIGRISVSDIPYRAL
jgi:hypothetical protein